MITGRQTPDRCGRPLVAKKDDGFGADAVQKIAFLFDPGDLAAAVAVQRTRSSPRSVFIPCASRCVLQFVDHLTGLTHRQVFHLVQPEPVPQDVG